MYHTSPADQKLQVVKMLTFIDPGPSTETCRNYYYSIN